MTIPTHNLYDFVHQQLENNFLLSYFYPFGSKNMDQVVCYYADYIRKSLQSSDEPLHYTQLPAQLQIKNESNIALRIFPDWTIDLNLLLTYNQRLLCFDQEPLNFDFYQDKNNHLELIKKRITVLTPGVIKQTENLRWCHPENLQKKWILLHSELNSEQVKKYNNTDDFVCAYWWSHAIIALDWYRFAEYDKSLSPSADIKKMFLIYSRDITGTRKYRKEFLEKINSAGVSDYQLGSFSDEHITSDHSAVYNTYDINHTGINVVLETVFDERIHLTEKTLRPIACGQPFILVAGPNSLKYIQQYGFKTFSPLINEDYDTISDPKERLEYIVKELKRIENLSDSDKKHLLSQCNKIAQHNKKVFFSEQFQKQVVNELKNNVAQAAKSLKDNLDWKKLKNQRQDKSLLNPNVYDNDPKDFYIKKLIEHFEKGGTLENCVPPDSD